METLNPRALEYIKNSLLTYNDSKAKIKLSSTPGPSIDAWDTTYLPPQEWALGIFEDAMKTATLVPDIIRRYDSPRKVTVPVQQIQSAEWSSTVSQNIDTTTVAGSTKYDATGIPLDPVEYRTVMRIARKSLDEATWSVAADVQRLLTNVIALKLDTEGWTGLSTSALSSGKYQAGGETLENTTTTHAVDYGTALTVDNVIDAIYNVKNTSYGFFRPNRAHVTAAMVKELVKSSTFINAAEFGNDSFVRTGEFANFLGLQWKLSGNIPQDSGSTDIGLIFDNRYYLIANIPIDYEIDTDRMYGPDQIGFYCKCKAAFAVGDKESGSVLYT